MDNIREEQTNIQAINSDAEQRNNIKTAYSKAYKNQQRRVKYDRIEILAPKGTKAKWQAQAKAVGKDMSEFVMDKVNKR